MERLGFHIADYVVMAFFLVVSSAIGIYFGFVKKQTTTEEYILGNREIHLVPVAISLAVTFQSATSILGIPSEIYLYNIMTFYLSIGIGIAYLIQAFFIVPLVHPLQLTSAYEYLERRFKSRAVQLLGMTIGMLQTLLYLSIVLYSPALALEAVAGIPIWWSIILIGIIGTFYTSIGGIRTVIWTDVFQFIMLYGGIIVILVLGVREIGSFSKVIELSIIGDRMKFDELSFDPRVRHTVWGLVIGGIFIWLPNCCNQSSIQRISSIHKERDAKISSIINAPLVMIFCGILCLAGLILYAYFVASECDPLASGELSNPNQIIIYFVMKVLNSIPGLAGILLAAIFSGALSSLSSGINSMAVNTVKDVLADRLKDTSQTKQTCLIKIIVLVYGLLAVGIAYMSQFLTGPVTQLGTTAFGAAGGPVFGIFFMGAVFPQVNKKGALIGGVIGIAFNLWIALGSFIYGLKAPLSTPVPTNGCYVYLDGAPSANVTGQTSMSDSSTFSSILDTNTTIPVPEGPDDHLVLYDISYTWFGLTGFLVTTITGLVTSLLTGKNKDEPVDPKYILPCLRRLWTFDEIFKQGEPQGNNMFTNENKIVDETSLECMLKLQNSKETFL